MQERPSVILKLIIKKPAEIQFASFFVFGGVNGNLLEHLDGILDIIKKIINNNKH